MCIVATEQKEHNYSTDGNVCSSGCPWLYLWHSAHHGSNRACISPFHFLHWCHFVCDCTWSMDHVHISRCCLPACCCHAWIISLKKNTIKHCPENKYHATFVFSYVGCRAISVETRGFCVLTKVAYQNHYEISY